MTKKVIFLMVEGFSDKTIFEDLKKTYSKYNISFINLGGDIFGDIKSKTKIQNRIKNAIDKKIMEFKLKKSDIIGVLQVIDLDGCMIDNNNIVIDDKQLQNTYYGSDLIKVKNSNQKEYIEKKNSQKTSEIKRMCGYKKIGSYKYQIYYFARTMEHVIFDEPNPDGSTKVVKIDKFMKTLNGAIEDFLSEYFPPIESVTYEDKYSDSWNYVFKDNNSLHRFNNVYLLFEFVKILAANNETK